MTFQPSPDLSGRAALALMLLLAACTAKSPDTAPASPRGYLAPEAIPDSSALSPPPPEAGSLWARLDEAVAEGALTLQGSARFEQAHEDAGRDPQLFACALGVNIDEEGTPELYRLMRRVRYDGGASTGAAKRLYQRPRPFMLNGQPTCSPDHEQSLRGNGSYPSGHTAAGWTWGLVLAEIAPERATEIFLRAHSYGHSRLVCNVHWYSDVVQGQALAAATVAKLHDNAGFIADLAKAREEWTRVRALAQPVTRDCAREAEVLATPIPGVR